MKKKKQKLFMEALSKYNSSLLKEFFDFTENMKIENEDLMT